MNNKNIGSMGRAWPSSISISNSNTSNFQKISQGNKSTELIFKSFQDLQYRPLAYLVEFTIYLRAIKILAQKHTQSEIVGSSLKNSSHLRRATWVFYDTFMFAGESLKQEISCFIVLCGCSASNLIAIWVTLNTPKKLFPQSRKWKGRYWISFF